MRSANAWPTTSSTTGELYSLYSLSSRGRIVTISRLGPGPAVPLADHAYAAQLATAAGRLLVDLRNSGPQGADLKALGDRESHVFLTEELARHRPDDGVLSEEGDHHTDRLT